MLTPEVATALLSITGKNIFIDCKPEILDFTNLDRNYDLILETDSIRFNFTLPKDQGEFFQLVSIFGDPIVSSKNFILGWDVKRFLSYFIYRCGHLPFDSKIYDLKILEDYFGFTNEPPRNFTEAKSRLALLVNNKGWSVLKSVYDDVYFPLISKVLPKIEAYGLTNTQEKVIVHPYYCVGEHVNGRLSCQKNYFKSFNPHSLSLETRAKLKCKNADHIFMSFDYKNMDVSVLYWLSKDEVLSSIFEKEGDCYENIWEMVTGLESNPQRRDICKASFLPIMYGQGVHGLANSLNWDEKLAKGYHERLVKIFKTAYNWITKQQDSVHENFILDKFGRRRKFDDKYYKIRNYVVASPAALICLHKLVKLFNEVNSGDCQIVAHVHDEYILSVSFDKRREVYLTVKNLLESDDLMYSGLRLKVTCNIGRDLDSLEKYAADK